MTLVPFTACCAMLGIDAKTLRNWLRQANLAWAAHPMDARLKCLTREQVEQLATLHTRPLPSPRSALPALPEAAPGKLESEAQLLEASILLPPSVSSEADLRKHLSCLETKMTTMQEQLAHLALELLRERQRSSEQRMAALEALVQQMMGPSPAPQAFQQTNVAGPADTNLSPGRPLLPAELRARSRVITLIEYGAQGLYVFFCPHEGALPFAPESPEWFDWLAPLTPFRFVGPHGRFTAYRDSERGQRTRCWKAHRYFHGRSYKHYLGITDHLTIACLSRWQRNFRLAWTRSKLLSFSMQSPPSASKQVQL